MVVAKDREITKKEIDKIGDNIRKNIITSEDYEKISDYRSEYLKIISSFVYSIKNKKIIKENKAIISRRLKRMPSIFKKLKRFEKMKLSNMQDLGGVRVIFNNLSDVIEFSNYLKTKTYSEKSKNNFLFKNEKNYIKERKEDGYRSIHQIYEYRGKIENLKGYKLELQIRTKLQHQWATAIEIFDILQKTNIKLGVVEQGYNDFFNLVSMLFENKELNNYTDKEISSIKDKVKEINSKYKVLDKLMSITIAKEKLPIKKGSILMILDVEQKSISYTTNSDENTLKILYKSLEESYKDDITKDVVLVSLDNLKDLEKAYPNYFLDAKQFIKEILKEID